MKYSFLRYFRCETHAPSATLWLSLSAFIISHWISYSPTSAYSTRRQLNVDPWNARRRFESHCVQVCICLCARSSQSICSKPSDVNIEPITAMNYTATFRMRLDWPLQDKVSDSKMAPIFNEWFKSKSGFMCVQSGAAWVLNIDDEGRVGDSAIALRRGK